MIYAKKATGTVQEVCQHLETAVTGNQFGVLGVHDLKEKMESKGLEFGPQCLVYEVCNPQQAKKVLEADMSVANALPCRICVYEQGGEVVVSTLKPTAVLGLFGTAGLESVASEVEATITRIIDQTCGD